MKRIVYKLSIAIMFVITLFAGTVFAVVGNDIDGAKIEAISNLKSGGKVTVQLGGITAEVELVEDAKAAQLSTRRGSFIQGVLYCARYICRRCRFMASRFW